MTLTELRYVVTLAQLQHFGKAAERCNVNQSTLSIAVKKLEGELGIELFERSKSSVRPTPIGERVIIQAQRVLEEAAAIKDIAMSGKDQLNSPLHVGAIFTVGPYLFPHFIPPLQTSAPQMPLIIEESYTSTLRKRLRNGEVDVIIVALPFSEPDVVVQPLYDEPFVVLLPQSASALSDKAKPLSAAILDDENVLMLGEGHCFRDQVIEALPNISTAAKCRLASVRTMTEGSSLETLCYMVASGLGITILPQNCCHRRRILAKNGLVHSALFGCEHHRRALAALAWRASFPRHRAMSMHLRKVHLRQPPYLGISRQLMAGDAKHTTRLGALDNPASTSSAALALCLALESSTSSALYSVQDLLFHLPLRYIDRTKITAIGGMQPLTEVVIEGEVRASDIVFGRRRSLVCRCQDHSGVITLRFFHFNQAQQQSLQPGTKLRCFGEVRRGKVWPGDVPPRISTARMQAKPPALAETLTPIYPATEGVTQQRIRDLCAPGAATTANASGLDDGYRSRTGQLSMSYSLTARCSYCTTRRRARHCTCSQRVSIPRTAAARRGRVDRSPSKSAASAPENSAASGSGTGPQARQPQSAFSPNCHLP